MTELIAGLVILGTVGVFAAVAALAEIANQLTAIYTVLRREEEYGKMHREMERARKAFPQGRL